MLQPQQRLSEAELAALGMPTDAELKPLGEVNSPDTEAVSEAVSGSVSELVKRTLNKVNLEDILYMRNPENQKLAELISKDKSKALQEAGIDPKDWFRQLLVLISEKPTAPKLDEFWNSAPGSKMLNGELIETSTSGETDGEPIK